MKKPRRRPARAAEDNDKIARIRSLALSTTEEGVAMSAVKCELCTGPGGRLIHDDGRLRVVAVDEADYPGLVRVIWNAHRREVTDLTAEERTHLMHVVFAVERVQREVMRPHKINLASLGNMTPHVHWHVIPRYEDDAHFPGPIWAPRRRTTPEPTLIARRVQSTSMIEALGASLQAGL
jgi:diadenosine tetraphosphate (Ap4A) HIT family hydrolase